MAGAIGLVAALATAPAAPAAAAPLDVVVLGDSLSAGYGLPPDKALTAQLEAALKEKGYDVRVPNTAVSGDTTAGGLSRLDWLLADKPDLMIVALGGNDGLRAIDPAATRSNLDAILAKLKEKGVPSVLFGMLAPPNLGRAYGEAFNAVYPDLAKKYGVPLYPFILEGVALDPKLSLADGMHPNAEGVAIMVRNVLPTVTRALDAIKGGQGAGSGAADGAAAPGKAR
ncbi:MAG TPA: arylesterase [Azospirillaceae bacterium]|nr:arylesterase [Azospirillaceae bacterium]